MTGTSGHVGSAIATHLIDKGWEVVGLSQTPSRVRGLAQQVLSDIGRPSFLEEMLTVESPCDALVHAAAALDMDLYTPAVSLTNCLGTQQMLRLADMWHAASFIYISSAQVIGKPLYVPITEEHPTNPPTAYHASKLYGEHLTEIARRKGLTSAILRLTSPVGPGMPGNRILSTFVRQALANAPLRIAGHGTRRQNYVDVRDVAIAVERCLKEHVEGLFNIGGKCSISNHDLAHTCVRTLGSSSPTTFTEQPDCEEGLIWDVSLAKAIGHFGYDPCYTIEETIREMGDEYENRVH